MTRRGVTVLYAEGPGSWCCCSAVFRLPVLNPASRLTRSLVVILFPVRGPAILYVCFEASVSTFLCWVFGPWSSGDVLRLLLWSTVACWWAWVTLMCWLSVYAERPFKVSRTVAVTLMNLGNDDRDMLMFLCLYWWVRDHFICHLRSRSRVSVWVLSWCAFWTLEGVPMIRHSHSYTVYLINSVLMWYVHQSLFMNIFR